MLWLIEHVEQIQLSELVSLFPCLSEERREKVARFRHEPSAVQSALAELLLRHALREEYGLTELPKIETGEKGKPFFPVHPELQFNLSHCAFAVACALDPSPLGVDVQEFRTLRRGRENSNVKPLFFVLSDPERAWVEAGESPAEQDRRFTAVWTCKEAWGKARGEGILYELQSTAFLPQTGVWEQYGFAFHHWLEEDLAVTLCAAPSAGMPRKTLSFSELKQEFTSAL